MYSTSQFDGNAAFSGGGFMPSQATQATDSSSFSRNRDAQSLLPLTVKQINDAFQSSDDKTNLIIDGVDVNNVTLVGRVCNKAGRITDVTFVLDDGTGRIECNKWLQEAVDSNEVDGILDGMYVRLHGHLKGFQGKRSLNVFSFRPVTDFNEIASHFIDCVYVHLYNSKIRLQAGVPNQQHVTNSTPITPTKGYQAYAVPPNQFSGQPNNSQFTSQPKNAPKSVEDMVLDILHLPKNRSRDEGVPRDLIAQHLGIPMDKLMLAIKNLIEEGNIYEAIADHYKSIING
ncbi:PREDICTED: replication protein A 32 kDa subunit B-like isoform X1 [Lupinus angustifolius]|uniref:replication protein A 32 kDa subunit B-like isoform X1 n=1 Tax=Lupinus angustifolius TaxID=3871 RepID=UPI00092E8F42|nr:PREDICTED: replication protein A 32 kDa subunit B-like isoform X1 [Lupinus angustifolius]